MRQDATTPLEGIVLTGDDQRLYRSYKEYLKLQHLYDSAVKQITTRLEVLNNEFKVMYARNPIHHIESRVKSTDSIVKKLQKKGLPVTAESAVRNINDIAGIRVVCCYIDDVYRVEEMLLRQSDIELVKRQDYIKKPNFNGYRSLHLDLRIPIYLSNSTKYVLTEIQIRTVAMDFWASLEHDIRYKGDKEHLPEGINEEMYRCADEIAAIDEKMQEMYHKITAEKIEN